jgi:hypothetical protein
MYNSGYTPPEMPPGWIMGMVWTIAGMVVAICWLAYISGQLIDQKCSNKPRWSTTKILSTAIFLVAAAGFAILGTYLRWRHPFRLAPCKCLDTEFGPLCKPCKCTEHGLCDSGEYGSGRCACDLGWAGDYCEICADQWKPEGQCDLCKTGYEGDKCQYCAVGYTGEECDICDDGWRPWQNVSTIFPLSIAKDDNRHICDECLPNYYGYYCQRCPYGNDVPHITLDRNHPIVFGSRVSDKNQKMGTLHDLQVRKNNQWGPGIERDQNNKWLPGNSIEKQSLRVLQDTRLKIKYDKDNMVSDWITFENLEGFQCNNRGTCHDDIKHQELNPDWKNKCTYDVYQACTTNKDCLVSENCKGFCKGVELPINSMWTSRFDGKLCESDDDCIDRSLYINALNETYEGGRCVTRGCCDESFHGDGICECDEQFFGPYDKSPNAVTPQYKKSPGCDFCPGYDWITEENTTICSGKGTCKVSRDRDRNYIGMTCDCGTFSFIDPITKIPDRTKNVVHTGNLCECGDFEINGKLDGKCDICVSGYWGKTCNMCPGGGQQRQCSGHGVCDDGIFGNGDCSCKIDRDSSWQLAAYVKRYSAEQVGLNAKKENYTCSECSPNYWGDKCQPCRSGLRQLEPGQFVNVFQPVGSFHFGQGQSHITPEPLCHPQKPWICTFACGAGGWCDWGRQGDGTCMCWQNKRLNDHTWNPLDNVCIGNDRYNGSGTFDGTQEMCSTYGYCSGGNSARNTPDTCGDNSDYSNTRKDMTQNALGWNAYDDWSSSTDYDRECEEAGKGDTCYKWEVITFREQYGLTCKMEGA